MTRLQILSGVVWAMTACGQANATILTFNIDDSWRFGQAIPQAHGDRVNSLSNASGSYLEGNGFTPAIEVEYGQQTPAGFDYWFYWQNWGSAFGDLEFFGWVNSGAGYTHLLRLTADAGFHVRLNTVDYAGRAGDFSLSVLDASFNVLATTGTVSAPATGHATFSSGATGQLLYLAVTGDFFNNGIDNVNFDQIAVTAIPEPGTFSLISACLTLAMARRHHRRVRS